MDFRLSTCYTLVDEGYAVCLQAWQLKCGYNYHSTPPPSWFFFVGDTFVFLNMFFYMLQQTSKKYNKIYLLYIFYISLNCIFFSLLPLSVKFPLPIFFSKLTNWGSKFIRLKFILNRCLYAYNMNINIQGLNSWIPYKSQNLKTYILTFHDSSIV